MVIDNVIINKSAALERGIKKLRRLYDGRQLTWIADELLSDSIILTLQQSCEQAIGLAMHVTKVKQLGIPQTSRDAFDLLAVANVISHKTATSMKMMVGFRNVVVHEYQKLNPKVVEAILEKRLGEFEDLIAAIKRA